QRKRPAPRGDLAGARRSARRGTYHEEADEVDAQRRRRRWVELGAGVDVGAEPSRGGDPRRRREREGSFPRRPGAAELDEPAARQPPAQGLVEGGTPGRQRFEGHGRRELLAEIF